MRTNNYEKIIWDHNFSIGNVKIDEEHKLLLKIFNELVDYINTLNNEGDEFARLLSGMTDYSLTHFQREEQYMLNFSYPKLEEHKRYHKNYIYKVAMYNVNLLVPNPPDTKEILDFLKEWWSSHILKIDADYERYKKEVQFDVTY
jgi:hemerythrin